MHVKLPCAGLAVVLIISSIVGACSFSPGKASGWTYEDSSWWFGPSFEQLAGNVGVVFTYPDLVHPGDDLAVAVTLEYIKNENARSSYVIFSDIRAHLRDVPRLGPDFAASAANVTSGIVRPGEQYSHVFTIPAPELAGLNATEYGIDVSFVALFSRSTSLEVFRWDSGGHYYDGSISMAELPGIRLLPEDDGRRELTIRIKKPYAYMDPVPVAIDGSHYNVTGTGEFGASFQSDTSHSVSVPEKIGLVPEKIQAVFVRWSDGSMDAERSVMLDRNTELFAIYKTQYRLDMASEFGTPRGQGWHDSGSNAAFAVDSLAGAFALRAFDKWEGDYSGGDPFGTIMMDGPKSVVAGWKFDFAFIGGVAGAIAAVISVAKLLPPAIRRMRKS